MSKNVFAEKCKEISKKYDQLESLKEGLLLKVIESIKNDVSTFTGSEWAYLLNEKHPESNINLQLCILIYMVEYTENIISDELLNAFCENKGIDNLYYLLVNYHSQLLKIKDPIDMENNMILFKEQIILVFSRLLSNKISLELVLNHSAFEELYNTCFEWVIESKQPNLIESGAVFLQNLTTYEQGREFMIQHFNIVKLDSKLESKLDNKKDTDKQKDKIFDLYILVDTYIFALENDFRYKIDIMHPIIENLIFYDLEKHISNEDFYNLFNCAVSKAIECSIIDVVIVSLNLIFIYTKQKRYSDYVCENEKFIYTLFAYNHSKEYSDITTNIITNIIDNSIDKFHVKYGIDDIKIQGTSMFKPTKEFDDKVKSRINEIKLHKCSLCEKTNSNLRCARCKKTYYCGKECQTKDWINHKKTCVKI